MIDSGIEFRIKLPRAADRGPSSAHGAGRMTAVREEFLPIPVEVT
jgi:hypothetical protein